jgi:hypothetical protein
MFCPYAFSTVAIDVAVVGEMPGSVIEQKLIADPALRRRKKYRARIDLVIAWRDRLSGAWNVAQIFFVYEQAEREKNRDDNNRVQETTDARWNAWQASSHSAKDRQNQLKSSPTAAFLTAPSTIRHRALDCAVAALTRIRPRRSQISTTQKIRRQLAGSSEPDNFSEFMTAARALINALFATRPVRIDPDEPHPRAVDGRPILSLFQLISPPTAAVGIPRAAKYRLDGLRSAVW